MTTPTHVLAGGLIAELILWTVRSEAPARRRLVQLGCAGFFLGIASHLLLDLAPHFNWAVVERPPRDVPRVFYRWFPGYLFWPGVLALAAGAFSLACGRDHLLLTTAALGGAMFPDIEKILYFGGHISSKLVVFEQHSTIISNRTGNLPLAALKSMELMLIIGFAVGIFMLSTHRRHGPVGD